MVRVRPVNRLSPDQHREVLDFLDDARALGSARLSDHLRLDLEQGPRPGFAAALADDGGRIVGYAQASAGNEGFVVDCIVLPSVAAGDDTRCTLLRTLVAELPVASAVTWWVRPDASSAATALHLRLQPDRQLLMMHRDLPIADAAVVHVRSFVVGADEARWLEVNNAAFAAHGEQGGWDAATLLQREREPWFDPDGFLLHEREGRLAAFCWTKLHPAEAPGGGIAGEIYVIAVHPDFHGLGLGRALTVAGLQHMQHAGAITAILYVDATNTSAVRLYQSLGFTVARTEQSYRRTGAPR
ncbi:MAG: mycothiol synthase [Actinomycetota bacterium]